MKEKLKRTVVFFPLPLRGHINPMYELANILYSKGFSISFIYTKYNPLNPATYPQFKFHTIDDGLTESESSDDIIVVTTTLNKKCAEPFRKCFSKIVSDCSGHEPVACLITDAIWNFCQAVANDLQLHRIVLRTSGISAFIAFLTYHLICEKGYLSQDTETVIPELPPLRVKDIPKVNTRDPRLYQDLISDMVKEIKASSGLIFNSFEDLEGRSLATVHQEFSIPVYPIGPFHKSIPSTSISSLTSQDQSSISWLDSQAPKSVLYVSFGTLATINQTEFIEMAWALANSKQPFLWTIRPDLVQGSNGSLQFPDGFLKNVDGWGRIVSWAPQHELLAHPSVGGFWTHSGWNSTLESISAGVPMMCRPFFGDQRVTSRYVSDVWRIGLHLENKLDRGEMEKAIRRLMREKEGEVLRERILCLKGKAAECLETGGSSCKSLEALVNRILSF